MRRFIAPLVALVAFGGLVISVHALELQQFMPKDRRFSILFPGKPTVDTQKIGGAPGKAIDQIQYVVGFQDGAYLVSHQDAAGLNGAHASMQKKAFDGARDSLLKTFQGKLTGDREIKLARTYPGREVRIELPQMNGLVRVRMYLADGRFYQIMVVGATGFAASKDSDRFLDSFKIHS
jgi:hypothetical protein